MQFFRVRQIRIERWDVERVIYLRTVLLPRGRGYDYPPDVWPIMSTRTPLAERLETLNARS